MKPSFIAKSSDDRRVRRIRGELSSLGGHLQTFSSLSSRSLGRASNFPHARNPRSGVARPRAWRQLCDPRFLDHLAGTMQIPGAFLLFDGPWNKGRAFVLGIFLSMVAWWVIFRFFT